MAYPANLRGWGQGWPRNRSSEMATVRTRHGQTVQVHREIAPIVQFLFDEIERRGYLIHKPGQIKDDWGYANRPIRGRNVASNHSWGLAFDIDATQYPMGTRRNPPRWIVDLIEAYGFEWGGRWSRSDPMHFEWKGSLTEARFLVASLAASHVVKQPPAVPPSVPPPPAPPAQIEEIMIYLRDPKTETIFCFGANTYQRFTWEQWQRRLKEGVSAPDDATGGAIIFALAVSRADVSAQVPA